MNCVRKLATVAIIFLMVIVFGSYLKEHINGWNKDARKNAQHETRDTDSLLRLVLSNVHDSYFSEIENRRKARLDVEASIISKPRKYRTPDVIGIGARKCGTGAFRKFLNSHPLITIAKKEIHYYDAMPEMGLEYYKAKLPNATDDELIFEKTPAYFTTGPVNLPEIIKRDCPGVKIILIVCEPVKRAFSDYEMQVRGGLNSSTLNFNQYVEKYLPQLEDMVKRYNAKEDLKILLRNTMPYGPLTFATGLYEVYLQRWIDTFSPDNLLVIDGTKLIRHLGIVMEEVQEFLSLPKFILTSDFVRSSTTGLFCIRPWWEDYDFISEVFNVAGWKKNLKCSIKGFTRGKNSRLLLNHKAAERLRKFYSPFNEKLFEMIGRRFDW